MARTDVPVTEGDCVCFVGLELELEVCCGLCKNPRLKGAEVVETK